MTVSDILNEDVSDFASRLEAMTTDEVFAASREFVKEHPEASKIFVGQSARARHGRIDVLLRWLDETKPDLVVLEDLRTPDAKFSARCMLSATDWNCSPQRSLFRHEPADRKR